MSILFYFVFLSFITFSLGCQWNSLNLSPLAGKILECQYRAAFDGQEYRIEYSVCDNIVQGGTPVGQYMVVQFRISGLDADWYLAQWENGAIEPTEYATKSFQFQYLNGQRY